MRRTIIDAIIVQHLIIEGQAMATRIAVVHDDRWFRAMLAASLREQGHVVTVFDDQEMVEAIWPLSEDTNVRIIEVQGKVPGVRLVLLLSPYGDGLWKRRKYGPSTTVLQKMSRSRCSATSARRHPMGVFERPRASSARWE